MVRVRELDILRGVAILLVLCCHQSITDIFTRAGWSGVTLFFVLSGFLVSGLLFKEYQRSDNMRIGRFLIRRAIRIYPAFYVMLFATTIVAYFSSLPMPEPKWMGQSGLPLKNFLAEIFFLQNYHPGFWGQCWSLAVEEHFYVLLAITFLLLFKRSRIQTFDVLPKLLVCAIIAVLALRCGIAIEKHPYNYYTHYAPTHLRFDAMLIGVLISYYYHFKPEKYREFAKHKWLLFFGAVCFLFPCLVWSIESKLIYSVGFTTIAIGYGCLLMLIVPAVECEHDRSFLFIGNPLAYVGRYSYSIYLWHRVVNEWILAKLETNYGKLDYRVSFILFILASIALGTMMQWLVEGPSLKLRDVLFPSDAPAVTESTVRQRIKA